MKRLREETREQHEALEAALPFGEARLDAGLYPALLARFWGFYATWEAEAAAHATPSLAPVLADRAKLPLLSADVRVCGMDPAALPRMDAGLLPSFASEFGLLGSMYVVEGATLGGQVISRSLEREAGFHDGVGYSFFRSYGSAVGQQWKAFTALLETAPDHEGDRMVAAARQTFEAFAAWFAGGGFHAAPPDPKAP